MRKRVRIGIYLSVVLLLIYSIYTTWAIEQYKGIDIYQEERIRMRDEKIIDLEYDLARCQDAQILRCEESDTSILRQ